MANEASSKPWNKKEGMLSVDPWWE